MDCRLVPSLWRRLIDFVRLCAGRSLHWLLRILSAVSFRRRAPIRDSEKNDVKREPEVSCTDIRPVVVACSSAPSGPRKTPSTPKKPPPARSYTRHTALELYGVGTVCTSPTSDTTCTSLTSGPTCTSPTSDPIYTSPAVTLRDLPGSPSPACTSTSNQGNAGQALASSPDSPQMLSASPAGLAARPEKVMKAMLPSRTSRYDRNIAIKNSMGPFIFGPLETFTIYDDLDIPNWSHFVQPEGQLYFRNTSQQFHYLTEEYLSVPEKLEEANLLISAFEKKLQSFRNLPYNVEVVFEFHADCWPYYMVDLDNRRLFWLDDCVVSDEVLPERYGVENREQLRHMFDFEYWEHINYFPNHRSVQNGLLDELTGVLVHWHVDVATSIESNSAFTESELNLLIGSVKRLQSLQSNESALSYVVQTSARLMSIIAQERYYNFFGFHGARLSNRQSVRGSFKYKRSPLITLLSPILFYAPEVHLEDLEKARVDTLVKCRFWKAFQSKLERDWESFILYATVLVNANVAFLAIPSVISDDLGPGLMTSPAGTVSQVSTVVSLGSIIIGLLLVRQMRIGAKESSEENLSFLMKRTHPQLGLETLAILFSLPYALLMWGMATFLAAIAIICFYNMGGSVSQSKRFVYGVVWVIVALFILWTVVTGWEIKWNLSGRNLDPSLESSSDNGKTVQGEMELTTFSNEADAEARSVRSERSAPSRLTNPSTIAVSMSRWRSRVRKVSERPKRGLTSWFSILRRNVRGSKPHNSAHLESGVSS